MFQRVSGKNQLSTPSQVEMSQHPKLATEVAACAPPAAKKKMTKVMKEWKSGKLKSSSGDPVTDQKQAIAIGLSEVSRMQKRKRK